MLDIDMEENLVRMIGGKFALTSLLQKRVVELNRGEPPLIEIEEEPEPAPKPAKLPKPKPAPKPAPKAAADSEVQEELIPKKKTGSGRFEKAEPTIMDGEDLDVPSFLRKKRKG